MSNEYFSGLSYGDVSFAHPRRVWEWRSDLLETVLELVHFGDLGDLPPDPCVIASKGEESGLASYSEFLRYVWK